MELRQQVCSCTPAYTRCRKSLHHTLPRLLFLYLFLQVHFMHVVNLKAATATLWKRQATYSCSSKSVSFTESWSSANLNPNFHHSRSLFVLLLKIYIYIMWMNFLPMPLSLFLHMSVDHQPRVDPAHHSLHIVFVLCHLKVPTMFTVWLC